MDREDVQTLGSQNTRVRTAIASAPAGFARRWGPCRNWASGLSPCAGHPTIFQYNADFQDLVSRTADSPERLSPRVDLRCGRV